jgi:hypothetical protein
VHATMSNGLTAGVLVLLAMLLFIAISFRSVFLADIVRLYRHGLLLSACIKAMTRPEIIWFCVIAVAVSSFFSLCDAIFFGRSAPIFPHTAQGVAVLGLLFVFLIGFHLWDCIVNKITPLCFGTFFFGRLNRTLVITGARYIDCRGEFTVIPSGEEVTVRLARGTVGKAYLLMLHPKDPSVVLPIIDDDASYLEHVVNPFFSLATNERRKEILAEIARLRKGTNGPAEPRNMETA